jgi:hypothetical protein
MVPGNVTDENVAELIERNAEAAKAFIRGDMRTYFTLIRHDDDYVLMSPFGGEPKRGVDTSPESLEALERYVRNGEAELDVMPDLHVRRLGCARGDRTTARGGRWTARPGLVAAGDSSLSARRIRVATSASAC